MAITSVKWPAPENVRAYQTVRHGGASTGAYASFNLGAHVGDAPDIVDRNRHQLAAELQIDASHIAWLDQTHSNKVSVNPKSGEPADGSFTAQPETVCVVMTADCLPVLLCNLAGTQVAAVHCGWRGLAAGILENALALFDPGSPVMAWLGPAIGPDHFEVGEDVYLAFQHRLRASVSEFFAPQSRSTQEQKWLCDIYGIARQILCYSGVSQVYGGGECTYCQTHDYFSYRRDKRTGRQASLIWLAAD